MTKKDIVRIISKELHLPRKEAHKAIQKTFEAIIDGLKKEGRIELRNFGVFVVKERAPRMARNPRTGENVWIEAKKTVVFKPGKEMGDNIQSYQSNSQKSNEKKPQNLQKRHQPPNKN
ncbi:MAG: HU family DNA-binding protein [Planctomycetia bacterium]|nr:HU family DNA-binding protein [Planctomycetia bacterium]